MDGHLHMILGRLLERSEATIVRLDRIEKRLSKVERKPGSSGGIGPLEKSLKTALTSLIPLATAWATGLLETLLHAIMAMIK